MVGLLGIVLAGAQGEGEVVNLVVWSDDLLIVGE